MQYVFYALIAILTLVVWSIINERNLLRRLKQHLKEEWLSIPGEEYTSEKFNSLKEFYRSAMDDRYDIDDITWNDLDMDELYMLMNNTQSAIGEEYLYALLRKPCFSIEELEERNRLMEFFHEDETSRLALQLKLRQIGKLKTISVYEYMNRLRDEKAENNLPHYLMALGLILSAALIFIKPGLGGICTVFFVGNNIFRYYMKKAKIEKYLTVFSYLSRLLSNVHGIIKLDIPEIRTYIDTLRQDAEVFHGFQNGAALLVSGNPSGSLTDAFLDYLRMLFHIDLIRYNSMLSFFQKNREVLDRIFKAVGYLDSCLAASSFRDKLPLYCLPELTRTSIPKLSVNGLYHPLLETPVPNSITEDRSVLITGSNASGKSTFIKTLAINALLSQTIYTSVSSEYKASYFIIFSSMALRDSIFKNESYYIVEIKSLKRILDRVNKEIPTLVFIDEVLRGTNTLERIAASSRILVSLAKRNTLCFAATHDIELTHILENYYSNYHFQEQIVDNRILFDYKLYKGRAVSKNAIKLLSLLGYTQDIIKNAETAAEDFLSDGEWKKIP
jgi:DNA mismatch repair ATPase MutS